MTSGTGNLIAGCIEPDWAAPAFTDSGRRRFSTQISTQKCNRTWYPRDHGELFLYAGSENAARETEQVIRDVLAQHHMDADVTLSRWHPGEERWEDAGVPLPETPSSGTPSTSG
jgi:hypothetical protein